MIGRDRSRDPNSGLSLIGRCFQVVSELRDKEVRQRLRNTPLEMTYSNPTSEGIRRVSEFARKTGDFASLSVVDIR